MSRGKRRKRILVLAASPTDRAKISHDQEIRAMERELKLAPHGDQFELIPRSPAEPFDLLRDLSGVQPEVVHIIAHGGKAGSVEVRSCSCPPPNRDLTAPNTTDGGEDGLYLAGEDGQTRFLSGAALVSTFAAAGTNVRLVILAACHSVAQAAPLLAHVDAVVSMAGLIHDQSAVAYAKGFYAALGAGASLDAAHKAGQAAIKLAQLCDGDRPQLQVRDGLRAEQIFLAGRPRRSTRRRRRKRPGEAVLATRPRPRTPRPKRGGSRTPRPKRGGSRTPRPTRSGPRTLRGTKRRGKR